MRKTVLFVLGIASGVVFTIAATQMRMIPVGVDFTPIAIPGSNRPLDRFADAFAQVRERYVEKPRDAQLIDAAVDGMLSSLEDSSYLSPEVESHMATCTRGAECPFGVVGVEVTIENGLPVVLSAVDGTPAAKAGVMARDIVAEIDGEPTQGLTLHEVSDRFAGAAGAPIRLKILRAGQDKPIALTLTREARPARSVEARVEGGDIGYLRIAAFDDETSGALKKAIAEISAKVPPDQLKGYVLDLRNNPGGRLDSALSVANEFLAKGEIVDIRGREMREIKRYDASGEDLIRGKPAVALINGGSAAAAEILAGALQDNKRATIVGTRSFGEGAATSTIALTKEEGALRLTTGHYFTPAGHPINASGIAPDIEARQDAPDGAKPAKPGARDSQSYVPPVAGADKALNVAVALLHGAPAPAR